MFTYTIAGIKRIVLWKYGIILNAFEAYEHARTTNHIDHEYS